MAYTFRVHDLAIELITHLRPIVSVVKRHDRSLADQIRRAASSVPANLAEGSLRSGKDRIQIYRIAAGSASELRSHLLVAVAWGDISNASVADTQALLEQILAILWKLTRG